MSDIPVNPGRGTATGALPTSAFSTAQHHHHLGFPSASDDDVLAALAAVARAPDDGHDKDPDEHEIRAVLGQQHASFENPTATQQQQQQAQQPHQQAISRGKRAETASDGSDGQDGEGNGKAKEGKVWTCRTCGRQFARRFNCTTHERTHLDIRDYPCQLCPRSFTRRHDLERHVNSVHPGHQLEKMDDPAVLDDPIASTSAADVLPPPPPAAASTTGNKPVRKRHSADKGPPSFKIRRLEDGTTIDQPLDRGDNPLHGRNAQLHPAPAGPSSDVVSDGLPQLGPFAVDSSLLDPPTAHAAAGPSTSANGFDVHQRSRTPSDHDDDDDDDDDDVGLGEDESGLPPGTVERVENLHEANPDGHQVFKVDNTRKWACGTCGRMFVRRNNCKAHEMTHRDVREYPCAVCGRAFSRRHDLERHQGAVHPGHPIDTSGKKGKGRPRVSSSERALHKKSGSVEGKGKRGPGGKGQRKGPEYTMDENDDELGDEDEDEIISGSSTGRLRNGANDSRPSPGNGGAGSSGGGGGGGVVALSDKDVQGMTERGIAALQAHGNVSYDQAEALRALLASRVDLPSSPGPSGTGGSGGGGGGGTGSGGGNIDPTLQSLGGHQNGPAGSEAGGVVGARARSAAGRDPASLVTSSAQAALAALTQGAYDFPGLSGYK